jgi:predicted AAA+ superfamily ATPase
MEITAYRAYRGKDFPVHFWRTKSGQEVDFVLGDAEVAIEVKGSSRVDARELRGLHAFIHDYHPRSALVVSTEPAPRTAGGIHFLPWRDFLGRLWDGTIL